MVFTYPIAHVVVAGAVHVDVGPFLEAGGLNLRGVAFCGEGHETSARLNCHVVLEVEKHFRY